MDTTSSSWNFDDTNTGKYDIMSLMERKIGYLTRISLEALQEEELQETDEDRDWN